MTWRMAGTRCIHIFNGIKRCARRFIGHKWSELSAPVEDLPVIRFVREADISPNGAEPSSCPAIAETLSLSTIRFPRLRKRLFPLRPHVIAQGWTRWRASDNIMVSSRGTRVTLPKVFLSPQVRRVLFHHSARLHPQGFIRDPIPTPPRGYIPPLWLFRFDAPSASCSRISSFKSTNGFSCETKKMS